MNSSENNNVNTVVFLSTQYIFVDVIYSREVPHMQSMQVQGMALGQPVPKRKYVGQLMISLRLYELLMCAGLMFPPMNEQSCVMGKIKIIWELSEDCLVLATKAGKLNGPLATVMLWIAALHAVSQMSTQGRGCVLCMWSCTFLHDNSYLDLFPLFTCYHCVLLCVLGGGYWLVDLVLRLCGKLEAKKWRYFP